MARTMSDRSDECRLSFRLPRPWFETLERMAAERPPRDPGRVGGRKTNVSTLIREAIQDRFNLPSVDTEIDEALETVSA